MKKYCIYILIALLGISCDKDKNDDLSDDKKIFGRLFLIDPLANAPAQVPQTGKKLTIRYADSQDYVNYLFSTTSDANGYFAFPNLKEGRSYIIKYQETISGAVYEDSISVVAPTNTAVLAGKLATAKQAGLLVEVKDFSGNLLKEANVCLFTSDYNIGYLKGTCDGSSIQLKTNSAGKASHVGLAAGTYYLLATATIEGVVLTSTTKVDITKSIVEVKMQVTKSNGIHFITTDANSEILGNASICVFTSNILFQKNTCEGSNIQTTTDASGKKNLYKLEKGTYYIYSSKIIGKDTLVAKNTVIVGDQIVDCVLKLAKK